MHTVLLFDKRLVFLSLPGVTTYMFSGTTPWISLTMSEYKQIWSTVPALVSRANFVSITSYDHSPNELRRATRRRMSARPTHPLLSSAACTIMPAPLRIAPTVSECDPFEKSNLTIS